MTLFLFLFFAICAAIEFDFGEKIRRLYINVGPNITPLMPDENDDGLAVLAVEANIQLFNSMPRHPRLFVVYAAIGAAPGFAQFQTYNWMGQSGSLSVTAKNGTEEFAATNLPERSLLVPVLTMHLLLSAIPSHIRILFLKTDMQGHDYAALVSAGSLLNRVGKIMCECYSAGTSTYQSVHNECDRDIDPLLSRLGFYRTLKSPGYVNEFDVTYVKKPGVENPAAPQAKVASSPAQDRRSAHVAPVWLPVVRDVVHRTHYSQCGQDFIVRRLFEGFGRPGDQFYVDLAANDPVEISNTYALDLDGWSGLCIEANPQYWYGLTSQRTCTVIGAAVAEQSNTQLDFVFNGVLGGILGPSFDNKPNRQKTVRVPTMSLADAFSSFDVPHEIGYFSLDVEGAEWLIMQHFPFANYTFSVLTVERPGNQLRDLLTIYHYVFIGFTSDFGDELWLSKVFLSARFGGVAPTMASLRTGFEGARCGTI